MRIVRLIPAVLAAALMTGCQSVDWSITGECSAGTSGANCKVGGSMTNREKSLSQLDAASFSVDTSGSSFDFPLSGSITLSLVNSESGSIQATRVSSWVRSGSRLYLAAPEQVNSWAYANGQASNTLAYELHEFNASSSSGQNVVSVSADYQGAPQAASVSSFYVEPRGSCRIGFCQEH